MKRLSDEDIARIADAVAERIAPRQVIQPVWVDPRFYAPAYPACDPLRVTCGTISGSSDGFLVN